MYDTILLPTDGSPQSEAAIDHAIDIAQQRESTIHVLSVAEIGTARDTLVADAFSSTIDRIKTLSERATETVATRTREAGITTQTAVREGSAAETIIEYAAENEIALIVMATHGRTGDEREVIGSVTERVVRQSSVPVLTVQSDMQDT